VFLILYNNCLAAKNSRIWSLKASVGMPPNVMTQNNFFAVIKRNWVFTLNKTPKKKFKIIILGMEHQFFDPF